MLLSTCHSGTTGVIKKIHGDDKIKRFLFSLGCAEGDQLALISVLGGNYIVGIKDSRYALDKSLAGKIELIAPQRHGRLG
ncbi:MAG TPA: ferrous iron transport protein A [Tissierellia bacterium]|nr:ferrous iron transport protein A [Tissierellia bacterium]